MTVNERLWFSGLMSEFDNAVRNHDVHAATAILQQVDLNDRSIEPILQQAGMAISNSVESFKKNPLTGQTS